MKYLDLLNCAHSCSFPSYIRTNVEVSTRETPSLTHLHLNMQVDADGCVILLSAKSEKMQKNQEFSGLWVRDTPK